MSSSIKKAAVYARVSTVGHGQSVDMQLLDLRKLAEQRGFTITNEYCDTGQSGSKNSRPALDTLLADAKRGKFRVLLIWKLDRLGRSTAHLIHLLEDFKAWGVELVSFTEGLDFSSSTGKLFYTLISAFAEFERDTIRDRVRAGLRNARAKGRTLGRPRVAVDEGSIPPGAPPGRVLPSSLALAREPPGEQLWRPPKTLLFPPPITPLWAMSIEHPCEAAIIICLLKLGF